MIDDPDKLRRPRPPAAPVPTIDGVRRSEEAEARLNAAVHAAMTTEPGKAMLDWLRSITTQSVLGAQASSTELHYQEGMRMVTALIQSRIDAHTRAATKGPRQ